VIVPVPLKAGDTIGIAAPASPVAEGELAPAVAYLERRGYRVVIGEGLYRRRRFLAGDDGERAAQLNDLFARVDIHGIFVARGGYGSVRVLEHLDWDCVRVHPKVFVGFSDTTALQLGMLVRADLVSFTGLALKVDVTDAGLEPDLERCLWSAVSGGGFDPVPVTSVGSVDGAEGILLGGCLSLVCTLLGTPFEPTFDGALLFLEDVGEAPYRVDRMLTHLRMAGVFDRTAGILFGQFHECRGTDEDGSVDDVIEDLAQRVPCPVWRDLPYGHEKSRRVLPVGLPGRVEGNRLVIEVRAPAS